LELELDLENVYLSWGTTPATPNLMFCEPWLGWQRRVHLGKWTGKSVSSFTVTCEIPNVADYWL